MTILFIEDCQRRKGGLGKHLATEVNSQFPFPTTAWLGGRGDTMLAKPGTA